MLKAMETGKAEKMDCPYRYDGIDRWYSTVFIRNSELLAASNLDMTEQKEAELKMRQMETEQQPEVFQVSLSTLE